MNKKRMTALVVLLCVMLAFNASAVRIGDEIGSVLYTNVRVYINGHRIPNYNINNNSSVVILTDLERYGFDLVYDSPSRTITVLHNPNKIFEPITEFEELIGRPGNVAFRHLYTDIRAFINGRQVTSYNIRGNTAILLEDLRVFGTLYWDGARRESRLVTHVPVASITRVPSSATAGVPLALTGTVNPANASNKNITWSVVDAGVTGALINNNMLSAASAGTVTVRASIANGVAAGSDYTQNFNISIGAAHIPVSDISGVPEAATAGVPLVLSGTVSPENATNKNITWSVVSAGTTGASIAGNTLRTTGAGTVTVRASIANGATANSNYNQNFIISVGAAHIPVSNITGVPTAGTAGVPLTLTGTVNPANDTHREIIWTVVSAGGTGASIAGNTLNTTAAGTVTIRAGITNGASVNSAYNQNFNIIIGESYIPVSNITGVPAQATAGTPLSLASAIVSPADATNKNITWSIVSAGGTGAVITGGNTLNTTAPGTVTVRASITNGASPSTSYTQNFNITVGTPHIPVTNITGVLTTATAGVTVTLTGTVSPSNATNREIIWSVASAGSTGAAIAGNTLTTTAAGTLILRATIINGATANTNYTHDFPVTIINPPSP